MAKTKHDKEQVPEPPRLDMPFVGKEPKVLIWFDASRIDDLKRDEITEIDQMIYGALFLRPEHDDLFPKGRPKTDHWSQEQFARHIGTDPSAISRLIARRVLTPAMPWRVWFLQWVAYMQGLHAGRRGNGYGY